MPQSRSVGLKCVVLSITLGLLLPSISVRAADMPADLPPPPESGATGLAPIEGTGSAGAELPPPPSDPVPGAPNPPTSSANAAPAPGEAIAPPDATSLDTPAGESIPVLPPTGDPKSEAKNSEAPMDTGLTDVPSEAPMMKSPGFSSSNELKNVAMGDRIKAKDLVLWLSLGPSYGTLTAKGSLIPPGATSNAQVGGLGYNAGIGFMVNDLFQFEFDFTGTPKSKDSTVDNAMFGFGPRFGFLSLMGLFGVQQSPDALNDGGLERIFAIGARASLDLILSHSKDSRTSVGLSPEVYYIGPQGADGFTCVGASVSLRIYGFDEAF
jgi:hypothetical protein